MNRRALLLAPLGFAALAGAGFWTVLSRMREGTFDPKEVPSQLIGRKAPEFAALPALDPAPSLDKPGFGSADLFAAGRPILVNFFASWCVPCIVEAPSLMALSREGVPIWGIAYKDKPEATRAFLDRHGNPYARVAVDQPGRVAIDWGVSGVPESYLLGKDGTVRWRVAGPLTPEIIDRDFRPALNQIA